MRSDRRGDPRRRACGAADSCITRWVAVSWVMKIDLLLVRTHQVRPFFALLRKTGPAR
jgi:hypothetical protein